MSPEVNDLVVSLLVIVAQLVIAFLGGSAVRWLKARYTAEQIATGMEVARIAVRAAEQIAAATGWDKRGQAKLDEALRRAREIARQRGLNLSDEQWETILEAAVLELRTLGEEMKRPPAA